MLVKEKIEANQSYCRRGGDVKTAIQAEGAMYIPETVRYSKLLELPEGADIGKDVNDAMKALGRYGSVNENDGLTYGERDTPAKDKMVLFLAL